jgi:hypothetical protein
MEWSISKVGVEPGSNSQIVTLKRSRWVPLWSRHSDSNTMMRDAAFTVTSGKYCQYVPEDFEKKEEIIRNGKRY